MVMVSSASAGVVTITAAMAAVTAAVMAAEATSRAGLLEIMVSSQESGPV